MEDKEKEVFNVYIDESGRTPYYNDIEQPVTLISGVGVNNHQKIELFEIETRKLLKEYNLSISTELHAYELISGKGVFSKIEKIERENLFFKFLNIGLKLADFIHSSGMLKPMVVNKERDNLRERNLTPFLYNLYLFVVFLDVIFYLTNKGSYVLIFDKSSFFNNQTKKLIKELEIKQSDYYNLKRIYKNPVQIDSKDNRFIQLADFIGFLLVRKRQLEIKTYTQSEKLKKYEKFINKCYKIIEEKKLPFLTKYEGWHNVFNPNEISKRKFDSLRVKKGKRKLKDDFDPKVSSYWGNFEEKTIILSEIIDELLKEGKIKKLNKGEKNRLKNLVIDFEKNKSSMYYKDRKSEGMEKAINQIKKITKEINIKINTKD